MTNKIFGKPNEKSSAAARTARRRLTSRMQSDQSAMLPLRQRRSTSKPRVASFSERTLGKAAQKIFYSNGVTSLFFSFRVLVDHTFANEE